MNQKPFYKLFYKIVTILALVWNSYGVFSYFMEVTMTEEQLNQLNPIDKDMLMNTPTWYVAMFAVAVWFGFLGAILLCLKHRLAILSFIISLIGVIITFHYTITQSAEITELAFNCLLKLSFTFIFHLFLIFYIKKLIKIKIVGKEF